ncbi:MAG: hypothetical protein ACREX4_01325 [Gammaproteobacteria bacterium]
MSTAKLTGSSDRGALREVSFSNSLIEAWWRSLEHQWLYLNTLDTVATLLRLVDFYVKAHNSEIPHAPFNGPTPDEMYFGTGSDLPDRMQAGKAKAREARLAANRKTSCRQCQPEAAPDVDHPLPIPAWQSQPSDQKQDDLTLATRDPCSHG